MASLDETLRSALTALANELASSAQDNQRREALESLSKSLASRVLQQFSEVVIEFQHLGLEPATLFRLLGTKLDSSLAAPKAKPSMFRTVPMPPGLANAHLREAMDYTTGLIASMNRDLRLGTGKPLIEYIQANNFSGIVSNILTDAMDKFSPYKHNGDQRYPDLKDGSGVGLEMKAANKAGKGGESHNGHSGWHLIACFEMQKNGDVQFVQVSIAELVGHAIEKDGDWHYCGSTVGEEGSQRTETYYTTDRGTWKLRDGSVYLDTELVDITSWKRRAKGAKSAVGYRKWQELGIDVPSHSPFHKLVWPEPEK